MHGHCIRIMYTLHATRIYGSHLKFINGNLELIRGMCGLVLQPDRCMRSIVFSKHV